MLKIMLSVLPLMFQFLSSGLTFFPICSGLYGVGKAAENPPALVVLSHTPASATRTIAWVGKGIVYDTGGLCIKAKVCSAVLKNKQKIC